MYIVDGPEGDDAAPEENDEPVEEDAPKKDTAPESGAEGGSGGKGVSSLDLSGLFENTEEVDEAFKDLVDSVGDVAASDLAIQLQELLSSLEKRS